MHWPGPDGWLSDGDADSYHWGLKSYRQAVVEQVDALVGVVNGCIIPRIMPDLRVYLDREAVSGHDDRMRMRRCCLTAR